MNIAIFGLGYVGAVTAACLADDGHTVVGVDPSCVKRDLISRGESPIVEPGLGDLMRSATDAGRLSVTADYREAIEACDAAFICVGTPSLPNGGLNFAYVENVASEIGSALADRSGWFTAILRSTVLPGTTKSLLIPALERASGKKAGIDFGVAFYPEFLREGTAIEDYREPPKIVVAATDDTTVAVLEELNAPLDPPTTRVSFETAEMVKYVDNTWHALKVGFANEVGRFAKAVGTDSHEVMDVFCLDTKLNISSKYLRPGFAFGGSCLPKDLRALSHAARSLDLDLPIVTSVMPSNDQHIAEAFDMVSRHGSKKVAVLGLSFKPGTDDLREAPMVELVERLIGKGFDVRICDPAVQFASLHGANADYIMNHIPHISSLLVDSIEEALEHGDVVILGTPHKEFDGLAARLDDRHHLVDLVRIQDPGEKGTYDGIGW
jgi:GDP-mannose 6-dehydrogenase